jgi:hypothetical protein
MALIKFFSSIFSSITLRTEGARFISITKINSLYFPPFVRIQNPSKKKIHLSENPCINLSPEQKCVKKDNSGIEKLIVFSLLN